MKIIKISCENNPDSQFYSVTTIDGKTYEGYGYFQRIYIVRNGMKFEAHLDI